MGQWIDLGTKSIGVTVVGQAQPGSFSVSVSPTQVSPGGTVNVNVTVQNPNPFSTGSSGTATFTFTAPTTPGTYRPGEHVRTRQLQPTTLGGGDR